MNARVFLILIILCFFQSLFADESNSLANLRSQIKLPPLTKIEKENILDQISLALNDVYVHRDLKIQTYGSQVDPQLNLLDLKKKMATLPLETFYERLHRIFKNQRDLHTKLTLPYPYSCYRSHLDISFTEALGPDLKTHLYVQSSKRDLPIEVGDEVTHYDGKPIENVLSELSLENFGANIFAAKLLAIQSLFFLNHQMDLLPKKNSVTISLIKKNGTRKTLSLPWKIKKKESCISSLQKNVHLPYGATDFKELEEIFSSRPSKNLEKLNTQGFSPTRDGNLKYKILRVPDKKIGIIKLESLNPMNLEIDDFIKEFNSVLDRLDSTDHLLIDVRNNTGGYVQIADSLTQFFSSNEIVPIIFRQRANATTKWIVEHIQSNQTILNQINKSIEDQKSYIKPLTFHEKKKINDFGQNSFGKVIILTNARCYSSCDLFVSEMKSQTNALIVGEDGTTGAGGATVLTHDQLYTDEDLDQQLFKELPYRLSFSVAWQQILPKNGGLLEQVGVPSDIMLKPTLEEKLLQEDRYYLRIISTTKPQAVQSAVWLEKRDYHNVKPGSQLRLMMRWKGTNAVKLKHQDQILAEDFLEEENLTGRIVSLKLIKDLPSSLSTLDLIGYNDETIVWRKKIKLRTLLKNFQGTEVFRMVLPMKQLPFEFSQNSDMKFENSDNLSINQFNPSSVAAASLFVELPTESTFKLNFFYSLELMGTDKFSVVLRTENDEVQQIAYQKGFVYEREMTFNLEKYRGKKIEIEFKLETGLFPGAKKLNIRDLKLVEN